MEPGSRTCGRQPAHTVKRAAALLQGVGILWETGRNGEVTGWCLLEESGSEESVQPVAGGPHMEGSGPLPPSSAPSVRPGQPRGITLGPEGSAEGQPDDMRPVTMGSTGLASWVLSAVRRGDSWTEGHNLKKKKERKPFPETLSSWMSSECTVKSA